MSIHKLSAGSVYDPARRTDTNIRAGRDGELAQMLGHKNATMTLDLYGHLFGDRLDVVADAMDSARASALSGVYPLCTTVTRSN